MPTVVHKTLRDTYWGSRDIARYLLRFTRHSEIQTKVHETSRDAYWSSQDIARYLLGFTRHCEILTFKLRNKIICELLG